LDDTEFAGFDMGARVTQDLLVTLLGIWQEMSVQLEIMWQMLQVSMVQLDIFGSAAMIWCHKPKLYVGLRMGCQW